MHYFNYNHYIKCIHSLRLNAVLQLAEESTEYIINKKVYSHDKLIKTILSDKKELCEIINEFLNTKEKIKEENLIKFTNSYITKKYKAKEADIVYKLRGKEIFFLIEHQSKVDNNMSYRMLNYCIDIMQEWKKGKSTLNIKKYPLIIPIVIYTGDKDWTSYTNFKDKQYGNKELEINKIDFKYNLIDSNKYTFNTLIKMKSMFGYSMAIEKAKDKNELIKYLEFIIANEKDKQRLDKIADIIIYLLVNTLNTNEKDDLLDKIDKKVGEKNMSTLIERLRAERIRDRKEAKKEANKQLQIELSINMINMKFEDNIIIKLTKIEKSELEKLKEQNNKTAVKL